MISQSHLSYQDRSPQKPSALANLKTTLLQAIHPFAKKSKWKSLVRHIYHKLLFHTLEGRIWVRSVAQKRHQWIKKSRNLGIGFQAGFNVFVRRLGHCIQGKSKAKGSARSHQNVPQRQENLELLESPLGKPYDLLPDDHKLMSSWSIHTDGL